MIGLKQVGITGVGVDDHFVDFGKAISMGFAELVIIHAKTPMGIAVRKTSLRGQNVNGVVIANFKDDGIKIKSVVESVFVNFIAYLRASSPPSAEVRVIIFLYLKNL